MRQKDRLRHILSIWLIFLPSLAHPELHSSCLMSLKQSETGKALAFRTGCRKPYFLKTKYVLELHVASKNSLTLKNRSNSGSVER